MEGYIEKAVSHFLVDMKGEEIVDTFDADVVITVSEEEKVLYFSWIIGRIGIDEAIVKHHGQPDPLFDEDDLIRRSLHWVVSHPREMHTVTDELGGKVEFKFRGITFFFSEERDRAMIKCFNCAGESAIEAFAQKDDDKDE